MTRSNCRKLLAALFLCISGALASPAISRADMVLGLELGANFSGFSTSPDQGLSGKTGLLFGGFVDLPLAGIFYLEPELRYNQKGYNVGNGTLNELGSYIEVPVMLKARWPAVGPVTPFAMIGPDFGYNVSTYYSNYAASIVFSSIDVAADVGAGVEFDFVGNLRGLVQARYSLGLTNAIDSSTTTVPAGTTGKSHGLQVSVGVEFPI